MATTACAAIFISCAAQPPSAPRIALTVPDNNAAAAFVEVRTLASADVAALRARDMSREEWTAILRVTVAGDQAQDRPAVAGTYEVTSDGIRFKPMFPFDPGRQYEVRFDRARIGGSGASAAQPLVETVNLPKADVSPTTRVAAIYPTGGTIPENQLRFYVTFSAPMGRKGGLDYIHLLDAAGREVKDPFLPLDAEFWNHDRTRYTVFVDPGRVKRGVLPNEEMGRSLTSGRTYTMVVDREWRDAQGLPLEDTYRRELRVGPPDERPLSTTTWTIAAPVRDTRDPLVVTFPEPLDHGLLQRALGVAKAEGPSVAGEITIDRDETRWSFTPRDAWREGAYKLVVLTILEDLAGNRIGRAFEVDQFDRVDSKSEPDSLSVPFRVSARSSQ